MNLQRAGLLLVCVAGIYASYLTQGLMSEALATKRYGPENVRFTHLEALNGAQSLICFAFAFVILQASRLTGSLKDSDMSSWLDYMVPGITNSIGPALGMMALRNITYSAQVLVKSCKMVPVMIAGTLLNRKKRYSPAEYICMMLVGVGVALFGSKSSHSVASKLANPNTKAGYTLCLFNLAFDGYTNAKQDEINAKHPHNPPIHMMCWMNFWTSLYYGLYLFGGKPFGMRSGGPELVGFCRQHPDAARDVLLFCVCGAVGQLFIFFTIKKFGSLTNTLICTTRKFFNILLSVMWSANPLLPTQWAAVGMVFTGLIASSLMKRHGKGHGSKRAKQE